MNVYLLCYTHCLTITKTVFGKLDDRSGSCLLREKELWLIPAPPSVPPDWPPPGVSGPSDVPLKDLQLEYSKVTCVKSSGDNGDTPLTASAYVFRRAVVYRVPPPLSPPLGSVVSWIILKNMFSDLYLMREKEEEDFIRRKTDRQSQREREREERVHSSCSELIFLPIYN